MVPLSPLLPPLSAEPGEASACAAAPGDPVFEVVDAFGKTVVWLLALAATSICVSDFSEPPSARTVRPTTRPKTKRATTPIVTRSINLFRSISGFDGVEPTMGTELDFSVMGLNLLQPRVSPSFVVTVNSFGHDYLEKLATLSVQFGHNSMRMSALSG